MGKQAKPSTEKTQTQPPAFVSAAQQSMLGSIQGTLGPYMMGNNFNPDQMRAYEMTRAEAENPTQIPFTSMAPTTVGGVSQAGSPIMAPATGAPSVVAPGAQLAGDAYKAFMNPYENDVVQTTLDAQRRELEKDLNTVRGRTAAASAFGGSGARGALQEAQLTNDYGQRRDALVANLRAQGFDKANALAQANAQMQQQTFLANAGYDQQVRMQNMSNQQQAMALNAANQQQTGLSNQEMELRRALTQSGLDQTVNQFNAGGQNTMALTNAGLRSQALQNLLGIGNAQYGYPLEAAKIMAAAIPKDYGSTSVTEKSAPQGPSMLQQLLGVGLSIAGAPMTGGTSLIGGLGSLFGGSKG
jgi:hypothetical protein